MKKKQFKCPSCGCEFEVEVFESLGEMDEVTRRNPRMRPIKVKCPKCGCEI